MEKSANIVKAVFAKKEIQDDPDFEISFSSFLKEKNNINELISLYERFINSSADFDMLMRKIIWRSMCKSFGNAVKIGVNVRFKHPETFEIGDNVFLGDFSYIQGRFDGTTKIGSNTWIGPQAYLDARNLIIGEYVGWGPGAKILGSSHTGIPLNIPIIQTDLLIKQTIIEDWADIGVNAVILPGINVGKGAIVGAGSVVTKDIEPFSVVGGAPAKFIKWREGYEPA